MTIASDSADLATRITTNSMGTTGIFPKLSQTDVMQLQKAIGYSVADYATTTRTGSLEEAWDLAIAEAVVVATAAGDQAAAIAAVAALDGVYPEWD